MSGSNNPPYSPADLPRATGSYPTDILLADQLNPDGSYSTYGLQAELLAAMLLGLMVPGSLAVGSETNLSSCYVILPGTTTQVTLAQLAAMVMGGGGDTSFSPAAFAAWFEGLPTSPPMGTAQWWNNSGIPELTPGGTPGSFTSGVFNTANLTAFALSLVQAVEGVTPPPSTSGTVYMTGGQFQITPGGTAGSFVSGTLSAANFASFMLSLPTVLTTGFWLDSGLLVHSN